MAKVPTLEQATAARLAEIRDLVRSGVTEHTGRAMRTAQEEGGEAIGRRFRGLKHAYPELQRLSYSPSQIARAVDRGPHRTKIYPLIYQTVSDAMEREGFEPHQVSPHEGRAYCSHCGVVHSRSQHRFHGPGSFQNTHLFAFGDSMKNPRRWKFFKENGELRARLVNPPLIIANGEKRKRKMPKTITMKRNRKGQFVAAGHRSNPPKKHHRKYASPKKRRKNWYGAGAIAPMAANPRKRRHNPPTKVLGVPIPNLEDTFSISLSIAGGLAGPPIAQGFLAQLLPASLTSSLGTMAPTLIKAVSYVAPPLIAYGVGGVTPMKYVIAAEIAGLVILPLLSSITGSVAGSLAPAGAAGYVSPNRSGLMGFGRGPAHGAHTVGPLGVRRLLPGMRGYVTPTSRGQLSAFPGVRSLSRASRFQSPRR